MSIITRTFLIFLILKSFSAYATDTLRFIGEVNFPTGEKFQETEIGGLSGLAYDQATKKLLAISDDRSFVNESRFYEFEITLTPKTFSLKPSAIIKLKNKNGDLFKKDEVDFEGIAIAGNSILASSEGAINRPVPIAPELYQFSMKGDFQALVSIPKKFLVGSRDNKSFEALSQSSRDKVLYMGSEEALEQDGMMATSTNSSMGRIILYKNLKPIKEIAYPIEKIETQKSASPKEGDTGLVDILAIDDKHFYTLERSYLPSDKRNVIRIFKCTITSKTTDISNLESLKNAAFTPVEKSLVADLDTFTSQMIPPKLDNIEGISFGPALPNGKKTMIVVSDNNFNKDQRTLFMAFEIIPDKK